MMMQTVASEDEQAALSKVLVRLPQELHAQIKEAAKEQDSSVNTWIVDMLERAIKRRGGEYDAPTPEQLRLSQIVDELTSQRVSVDNLTRVITALADMMVNLSRGDNYLLDAEARELGDPA